MDKTDQLTEDLRYGTYRNAELLLWCRFICMSGWRELIVHEERSLGIVLSVGLQYSTPKATTRYEFSPNGVRQLPYRVMLYAVLQMKRVIKPNRVSSLISAPLVGSNFGHWPPGGTEKLSFERSHGFIRRKALMSTPHAVAMMRKSHILTDAGIRKLLLNVDKIRSSIGRVCGLVDQSPLHSTFHTFAETCFPRFELSNENSAGNHDFSTVLVVCMLVLNCAC